MAKNQKRVQAGKAAWKKLSPSEKKKRLANLTGAKFTSKKTTPSKAKKSKSSKGGERKMSKKSKSKNGRKTNPVTWARGLITLAIGVGVPVAAAWKQTGSSGTFAGKLSKFGDAMISYYTGLDPRDNWKFKKERLAVGLGSATGAYAFHKMTGIITQKVKMPSLLPRF